ncbi:helix-turn-helix transcriptional regulator [Amycolatopsis rhizosphaerae]|uniref:Helix-turn-helix transcriptional regulator n=1 Tax=Amycolatopsis rhizosphaerae TaxID=2053003 RepID=A0A558BFA9_9PSEU|nr:helix-turn-helix transcriptional regulator [Amycolatopsis rhizosphaerae]TVT35199.1 helix-turn-helix transcriptional regulator [Amycolatopsis rhizosphaerae]
MVRLAARARELGAFLRDKRGSLAPAEAGLHAEGPRRTTGLRREEVARIAGVSAGYYTRLEQGRSPHPSISVLDALARALRLDEDERAYLFALGEYTDPRAGREKVPAEAQRLLAMFAEPTAAYVINRVSDVLAWNPMAAALFPHLVPGDRAPNNTRFVFTDPAARELFVRWDEIASDSAAHLRAAAGHRPDDPALRALIAELLAVSPAFAREWEQRDVRRKTSGQKEFDHPVAGRLSLDYEVLEPASSTGLRIVAYHAEPGTDSHAGLWRLATPLRVPVPAGAQAPATATTPDIVPR